MKDILNESLEIWELDNFYQNMKKYKTAYIYCFYNKINKKIYIGSSVRLCGRFSNYYRALNNTAKFHSIILKRVFEKYNKNDFLFLLLEKVEDKLNIIQREQFYLDKYKPFEKNGYNIAKIANSCFGIKHSEESNQMNSLRQQGERSLLAKLKNQDIINIFNDFALTNMNMKEIALKYRISHKQIQIIIKREQWLHIDINDEIIQKIKNKLPVYISLEDAELIGQKLKSGENPKNIAIDTGINIVNIHSINRGWTFKFIKEKLSPNSKYIYDFKYTNKKNKELWNKIEQELKITTNRKEISKKLNVPIYTISIIKRKLNLQKNQHTITLNLAQKIGNSLLAGIEYKEIMKLYNVCAVTIGKINKGILYPEVKQLLTNKPFIKIPPRVVLLSNKKKLVLMIKNNYKTKDIIKRLSLSRSYINKWQLMYRQKHLQA
jgi:group I intron endonuclease